MDWKITISSKKYRHWPGQKAPIFQHINHDQILQELQNGGSGGLRKKSKKMEKVCTYQIGRKMFFFFFWLMKDKYEFKDEFFPVLPFLRKEKKKIHLLKN